MSAQRKPKFNIIGFDRQQEFSIAAITRLPEYLQTRAKTDPTFVKFYSDLKASGSNYPDVTLFYEAEWSDGEGRYLLADGFHRVKSAEDLHLKTIPATIRPGNMQDAILFSIQQNQKTDTHAITPEDRHHAVKMMLRNSEFNSWSDRGISTVCGCGHMVTAAIRLKLVVEEAIPLPEYVQSIMNGKPTGRWTKYKKLLNRRTPTRSEAEGHRGLVNGKRLRLPKDPKEAQEQLDVKLQEIQTTGQQLRNVWAFVQYLIYRAILSKSLPESIDHRLRLIATLVSDAVVVPVACEEVGRTNLEVFKARCFDAILAKSIAASARRTIVVGYFGSSNSIGRLIPHALALGLEFMTPEEFVAEFGPKPETAE